MVSNRDSTCTPSLQRGGNAALDKMVAKLEPIKEKHADISYADMYTFAGKVAIEEMGGPTIGFKAGRVDEMDPSAVRRCRLNTSGLTLG